MLVVREKLLFLVTLLILVFATTSVYAKRGKKRPRKHYRPAGTPLWEPINKWDSKAEDEFAEWIQVLGESRKSRKCLKLPSCLKKRETNTLWSEEDTKLKVYADCADVPYVLRAYFAYKTKRPFAWHRFIKGGHYSSRNRPKQNISFANPTIKNFNKLVRRINSCVHSGFYRMHADIEGTDTFPVTVNRKTVRPGTVYYDPKGHVLIVYKVENNGAVRLIDGHPDNSLTHKRFGEKFARGTARHGGGFRAWRWYTYDKDKPAGQQFVRETNEDIKNRGGGLSAKVAYQKRYQHEGYKLDYYAWVRANLSKSGARVEPIREFDEMVEALCVDIQDRVDAVQEAIDAKLHTKIHPGKLPQNIYGTTGEWEIYSTPSRDARLKASARGITKFIKMTADWSEKNDKRLLFKGNTQALVQEYEQIWKKHAALPTCKVKYLNSKRQPVVLTLNEVMSRLFKLSFDPYMCPELRWGATPSSSKEFATCPDSKHKLKWYRAEQKLRNRIDRVYGVPTPLSFGPSESPNLQVTELLSTLSKEHEVTAKAPTKPLRDNEGMYCPSTPNDMCEDIE